MAEKIVKDSQGLVNDLANDCISRTAAIDALNGIINRFEQILRDIRESKVDDSVCGMCEYDGAFVGQSGDWCNECPGFEKDDCFKLSENCKKRWLKEANLPSAQPERKKDIIQKFHDYQVEWLKSHYDIELEPQLEEMIVRFLHDTANCYMMEVEHGE